MASATAIAPTAAEADALATAFFIQGVDWARTYCAAHPGVGALLLPEGLVIVDVVTTRQANLHNELLTLLNQTEAATMPAEAVLSATAYRPVRRGDENRIDIWPALL